MREHRGQWCRGRRDPSAPHDLTQPGALNTQGNCKACKQFTDRQQERKRKASRAERVAENRLRRYRYCTGTQDPTAPHDLTEPGARTPRGKCRRCHAFTSQRSLRRIRKASKDMAREARAKLDAHTGTAGDLDEDRGIPAFPRHPMRSDEVGMWANQSRIRTLTPDEADFAGSLLDEWPIELVGESPREAREADETDSELQTFRRAMVSLSQDGTKTPYTRALAWKALADTRGDVR